MTKTTPTGDAALTPEEIIKAALPPVTFNPDMSNIFKYAESFQQEVGALSLTGTQNSIKELYAVSTPALELALATLAESVNLKASLSDFFTAEAAK